MFICQYCDKNFESKLSVKCHEVRCQLNPNRKEWVSWRRAWNEGLTKETDERLQKISDAYKKRYANGEIKTISHKHSKETKEKLSIIRSEILSNNEECGGFRNVKWYKIKNINNEEYVVRGTWEYNFALKLNSLNILWIKNKYLNYFINEVKKTYNPDFYLPELNEYVEVKGYFSENDKIKMDAVIDQNPDVIIRFLQQKKYLYFIKNENATINEIPIYLFGEFQSGYKKVGKKKIEKQDKYCKCCGNIIKTKNKKYCSKECYKKQNEQNKQEIKTKKRIVKTKKKCLVCGKELKENRLTYCSQECSHLTQRKIKISNEEKIELLKNFSISDIANKFNISYNAVKKWKRNLIKK